MAFLRKMVFKLKHGGAQDFTRQRRGERTFGTKETAWKGQSIEQAGEWP